MFKYFSILLFPLFTACSSEYELIDIPNVVSSIENPSENSNPELDVLLVLDNSCSMTQDWDYISYGITQVPEELNDYGFDWRLGITSTDPSDETFNEILQKEDPGWAMITEVSNFRSEAGGSERGFMGALRAREENPNFFRKDVTTLIVFVSDEKEQSELSPDDFHIAWDNKHLVVNITGPMELFPGEPFCADAAPKYNLVSQKSIDICITEPWSILDEVVE